MQHLQSKGIGTYEPWCGLVEPQNKQTKQWARYLLTFDFATAFSSSSSCCLATLPLTTTPVGRMTTSGPRLCMEPRLLHCLTGAAAGKRPCPALGSVLGLDCCHAGAAHPQALVIGRYSDSMQSLSPPSERVCTCALPCGDTSSTSLRCHVACCTQTGGTRPRWAVHTFRPHGQLFFGCSPRPLMTLSQA